MPKNRFLKAKNRLFRTTFTTLCSGCPWIFIVKVVFTTDSVQICTFDEHLHSSFGDFPRSNYRTWSLQVTTEIVWGFMSIAVFQWDINNVANVLDWNIRELEHLGRLQIFFFLCLCEMIHLLSSNCTFIFWNHFL